MKCSLKDAENIYVCTIKNKEDIRDFIFSKGVNIFYRKYLIDLDPTQFLHFCMAVIDYTDNCDIYSSLLDFLSPVISDYESIGCEVYYRLFELNMDKVEQRVIFLRAADNSSREREFLNNIGTFCEAPVSKRL